MTRVKISRSVTKINWEMRLGLVSTKLTVSVAHSSNRINRSVAKTEPVATSGGRINRSVTKIEPVVTSGGRINRSAAKTELVATSGDEKPLSIHG